MMSLGSTVVSRWAKTRVINLYSFFNSVMGLPLASSVRSPFFGNGCDDSFKHGVWQLYFF
jgi:hypothetical protein